MISTHALVLYKNQPAFVSEIDTTSGKYTIEFSGGNQKVREKDIILLHTDDKTLISVKAALDEAQSFFSNTALLNQKKQLLAEAAELLEGQQSSLKEIAELVFGGFTAKNAWTVYRFLHETPWFSEDYIPRTKDEVERLQIKENEKKQESESRCAFLERLKKKKLILSDDAKYMQDIEALALGKSDKSKTLREAALKETPEAAHALLLETDMWQITQNPHPARYKLSMNSASIGLANPPEEKRLELAENTYLSWAIDNEWSSDPDDAVCFDGEFLWVHIADPASTVTPDSPVDIAARQRGATLYIPEGASRMLAEESLEAYALGLSPLSNALSFRILLDDSGQITDCAVFKTKLHVKRMTYIQADKIKDDNTHPYFAALSPLFAIAQRNIERRKKAGAVFIELPEVHISVTNENSVHIEPNIQTESGTMVREMMLLAGEAAARFAFKNNIPFPYVSQDAPDIPKDIPQGLAGQYRLRRSMKSRSVGVIPSVHAGLGLGMYSQVTSPLRRYSDLVAHQQLRAFIDMQDGKNVHYMDTDTVLERISAGDAALHAAVKAERASNIHWILVYLKQHPEWIGKAVVAEIKQGNAAQQPTVLIPALAQEAQTHIQNVVEINDEIYVKATNINIPELKVIYTVVDKPEYADCAVHGAGITA